MYSLLFSVYLYCGVPCYSYVCIISVPRACTLVVFMYAVMVECMAQFWPQFLTFLLILWCVAVPQSCLYGIPMYVYASSNSDLLSFNYCHFLVNSCSVIFNFLSPYPLLEMCCCHISMRYTSCPNILHWRELTRFYRPPKKWGGGTYVCTYTLTY